MSLIPRVFAVCLVLFSLNTNSVFSQIWLENGDIYDEAEEYLDGEEYEEALPLFLLLEKKGIINSNISYKIGKCYLNISGKKSRAIPYLQSSIENIDTNYISKFETLSAPIESYLLLGIAYRINYEFNKSLEVLNKVKELWQSTESEKLAEFHIFRSQTAKIMTSGVPETTLTLLEAEGLFPLYNPIITDEGKVYIMEKRKFYDAILSGSITNNLIENSDNITPDLGSDGQYTLVGISPDGNMLLFSGYNAGKGFNLFFSTKKGDVWKKIEEFPSPINSPQNETSAAMTSDSTLYFTSNRTGGVGGSDIYSSKMLKDGSWTVPVNQGKNVNTPLNEDFVSVSTDGNSLYFGSEGNLNMGGYDLFFVKRNSEKSWTKAVNLGYPVSTPDDDVYIYPTGDDRILYTHKLDIQRFDRSRIYRINLEDESLQFKVLLNGKLNFSDSIKPKEVSCKVTNVLDNSEQNLTTTKDGAYAVLLPTGDYQFDFFYNEEIKANQKVNISSEIQIDELTIESPEWIVSAKTQVESSAETKDKVVVYIKDILFSFNEYDIPVVYYKMLDSLTILLSKNNQTVVYLTGYADALGNTSYNVDLSVKRAEAVQTYLNKKGIPLAQINSVGKGEKYPIAINKNEDGTDQPEGRKFNRRVTIELKQPSDSVEIKKLDVVPDGLKINQ